MSPGHQSENLRSAINLENIIAHPRLSNVFNPSTEGTSLERGVRILREDGLDWHSNTLAFVLPIPAELSVPVLSVMPSHIPLQGIYQYIDLPQAKELLLDKQELELNRKPVDAGLHVSIIPMHFGPILSKLMREEPQLFEDLQDLHRNTEWDITVGRSLFIFMKDSVINDLSADQEGGSSVAGVPEVTVVAPVKIGNLANYHRNFSLLLGEHRLNQFKEAGLELNQYFPHATLYRSTNSKVGIPISTNLHAKQLVAGVLTLDELLKAE